MVEHRVPNGLGVTPESLADIAVEVWRIRSWLSTQDKAPSLPARHATARLEAQLRNLGVEMVDLSGMSYEPGLAVQVIDTMDSGSPGWTQPTITEMVAPIILWNGQVIREGLVVTDRGTLRAPDTEGGNTP